MNHDPFIPIATVALLLVIGLILTVALLRRRSSESRPSAMHDEPAPELAMASSSPTIPPPAPVVQLPNGSAATMTSTHVDGRPRCQASASCQATAVHFSPRIARSDGVVDFIRRAFGAPRRYRMVERGGGIFAAIAEWFRAGRPMTSHEIPCFCDAHIPLVRQIFLEQLSAEEHREQTAMRAREQELSYFESRGCLDRVQALTKEIELERDGRGRRRRSEAAQVVSLQQRPTGTSGASPN